MGRSDTKKNLRLSSPKGFVKLNYNRCVFDWYHLVITVSQINSIKFVEYCNAIGVQNCEARVTLAPFIVDCDISRKHKRVSLIKHF